MKTNKDYIEISKILKDYNESPWRLYGKNIELDFLIELYKRESLKSVIEYIKKENRLAYHVDEYYSYMD